MRSYMILACVLAAVAITLGAFGAHAWKDIIGDRISTYSLANDYHLWHALAILVIAVTFDYLNVGSSWPLGVMLTGMICFSGSLYLLSFPDLFGGTWRSILGPVTPIGGLLLIISWVGSAVVIYRSK